MKYEVRPIDRQAAVDAAPLFGLALSLQERHSIMTGELDDDERVQIFARHRYHRPGTAKYDFGALAVGGYFIVHLDNMSADEAMDTRQRVYAAASQWRARTGRTFKCRTADQQLVVMRTE